MMTRNEFENLREDALRKQIIIPLLREMGYQNVYEYHGVNELGKDIVGWKLNEVNKRKNLAIVAKATPMSGKASKKKDAASEVQTQIRQCFGESYKDPTTSSEEHVNEVWLVSNQKITPAASAAISAPVGPEIIKNVTILNGDDLWLLVEKHLPLTVGHYAEELRKRLPKGDKYYKHRVTVEDNSTIYSLVEQFPGAAQEKPLSVTPRFANDEAIKQFNDIVLRYSETGEALPVPQDLITGVEFSEYFSTFMMPGEIGKIDIRVQPQDASEAKPVKINFTCADGETFVCPHIPIRLIRSGTKEALIRSDEKNALFHLEFLVRFDGGDSSTVLSLRDTPYNPAELLELYKLNVLTIKGASFEIEDCSTQAIIGNGKITGTIIKEPTSEYVAFLEVLRTIQKNTRTTILVPNSKISAEEFDSIYEVYEIVTRGYIESEWHSFSPRFEPSDDLIKNLDASNASSKHQTFIYEGEITKTVLGVEIPLGIVRQTINKARLANYAEVKRKCLESAPKDSSVELCFEPSEGSTAIQHYLKWLPSSET